MIPVTGGYNTESVTILYSYVRIKYLVLNFKSLWFRTGFNPAEINRIGGHNHKPWISLKYSMQKKFLLFSSEKWKFVKLIKKFNCQGDKNVNSGNEKNEK